QNHPNPFNPTTLITFHLPTSALATLKVFDLAGREVATLVHGKMSAGEHQVYFDASALAAGVYLYRLEAGEQVATRKLVLLK
ncbi:T9SS type A sorting domain-containing protein, partial [candidate division KSB1 bacterium]|nr:T9SS type A sorting domain-containing protein [candidate division KSB1 bacterium]